MRINEERKGRIRGAEFGKDVVENAVKRRKEQRTPRETIALSVHLSSFAFEDEDEDEYDEEDERVASMARLNRTRRARRSRWAIVEPVGEGSGS